MSNIEALINLIDDPDEQIYCHVRDKLVCFGLEAIPYLEGSFIEKDFGKVFFNRVEDIINDIHFSSIENDFINWKNSDKDLLEGALIIAKFRYPNLDEYVIKSFIDEIRRDIQYKIRYNLTAYEIIKVFNRIFFEKYNFQVDYKNFHSSSNSYINLVTENKLGSSLSICILYSIIAQSLKLPIYCVNLPNHVVLAYMDMNGVRQFSGTRNKNGVLFYINPSSNGVLFDENEIYLYLNKLNVSVSRKYFEPCSNSSMLIKMLTNLITSYQLDENFDMIKKLMKLQKLLEFN